MKVTRIEASDIRPGDRIKVRGGKVARVTSVSGPTVHAMGDDYRTVRRSFVQGETVEVLR